MIIQHPFVFSMVLEITVPWDPLLDQRWPMPFHAIMKENGLENVQLHMLRFLINVTLMTFLFW